MIEFFDEDGIISPEGSIENGEQIRALGATVAITAFSDHIFDEILARYGGEKVGRMNGSVVLPVYVICSGGKNILLYKSPVGAPSAVSAAEQIFTVGVESVVAFGICGALTDVPERTLIVPDRAFRDEGTSRHYAPESEFIAVKNADAVAEHLEALGLSALKGGVWTTDGFYRETRARAEYVKSLGCVAVDMECAALQAACDFRGKRFYTFFITADSLAGEEWQPNYILDPKLYAPDGIGAGAAVRLCEKLSG